MLEMQVSKKRVTVGELKQELAKMKQSGHLPPLRILPEAGAIKGGFK